MRTFKYFAYGSNMLTRRLAQRTPSAVPVAVGHVSHHRLSFSKVGRDGSGKCHLVPTGDARDRVHGVVFTIDSADKRVLDEAEVGYGEAELTVVVAGGSAHTALAYVSDAVDPGLRPFDWYKAIVIAGATEHGLPADYIDWLHTFESQHDADTARGDRYRSLLLAVAR